MRPPRSGPRVAPLPGVTVDDVEPGVRRELRSLGHDREERVTLHLASAVAAVAEDDPETGLVQVDAAVDLAPRLGVVRETAGLVHYAAGDYAVALRELRTARRMGSGAELVPVIVDCERALDRPGRALELADEAAGLGLDRAAQLELATVVAGVRRDLGDLPAALRTLEVPELRSSAPSSIRLRYAYADLLEAAGREDEALAWFTRVAQVDADGETDAGDRLLALQGLSIDSEDEGEDDADGEPEPAADGGPDRSVAEPAPADDTGAEDGRGQRSPTGDGADGGVVGPAGDDTAVDDTSRDVDAPVGC